MTTNPLTPIRPATISKQLTADGFQRASTRYGTGFRVRAWTETAALVSFNQSTGSYGLREGQRKRVNTEVELARQKMILRGYRVSPRDGWTFLVEAM